MEEVSQTVRKDLNGGALEVALIIYTGTSGLKVSALLREQAEALRELATALERGAAANLSGPVEERN